MIKYEFDEATHAYSIDGRPVPSVTQVIRVVLGDAIWNASEWYLQRGHAVHAAAAFIARGKRFICPSEIEGQAAACRKFFEDKQPAVLDVERPVYSMRHQYAGTLDMLCKINGLTVIVDWKATLGAGLNFIQIGGYAATMPKVATWAMVVELGADGRYRTSPLERTTPHIADFLALRATYAIRQRLNLDLETPGMKAEKEEQQQ